MGICRCSVSYFAREGDRASHRCRHRMVESKGTVKRERNEEDRKLVFSDRALAYIQRAGWLDMIRIEDCRVRRAWTQGAKRLRLRDDPFSQD